MAREIGGTQRIEMDGSVVRDTYLDDGSVLREEFLEGVLIRRERRQEPMLDRVRTGPWRAEVIGMPARYTEHAFYPEPVRYHEPNLTDLYRDEYMRVRMYVERAMYMPWTPNNQSLGVTPGPTPQEKRVAFERGINLLRSVATYEQLNNLLTLGICEVKGSDGMTYAISPTAVVRCVLASRPIPLGGLGEMVLRGCTCDECRSRGRVQTGWREHCLYADPSYTIGDCLASMILSLRSDAPAIIATGPVRRVVPAAASVAELARSIHARPLGSFDPPM